MFSDIVWSAVKKGVIIYLMSTMHVPHCGQSKLVIGNIFTYITSTWKGRRKEAPQEEKLTNEPIAYLLILYYFTNIFLFIFVVFNQYCCYSKLLDWFFDAYLNPWHT